MSAGHNDPKLLYSIEGIKAYHLQNGEETPLTPSGPQTLSLLMVPTSSPFAGLSNVDPSSTAPEEDFYLHLHLPPELDMPLPATTQVYHQPPSSYLVPRWDLGPDAGAFTRIEFPRLGLGPGRVTQEDVDTFETILAQCTAFLERAKPPTKGHGLYNPADYAPGEGYVTSPSEAPQHGHIVLIDEENGSVVGELCEGYSVVESPGVKPGHKGQYTSSGRIGNKLTQPIDPVQIELPGEGQGNKISVDNASEEYLRLARHPAYKSSTIVQKSAVASRLIVTGSTYLANAMTSGAESFQKSTKPNPKPVTFTPASQARIRKINTMTAGAADMSAKTVGQIGKYTQNIGAAIARKGEKGKKGMDKNGNPDPNYKPGMLNKSMIAFSTIADGIDHGARQLLASGSAAATTIVGHKYGADARAVASDIAGGARNVGLVYIDAAGVSRKAVIKSVAKGMVIGRTSSGQNIIVGAGDGGNIPAEALPATSEYGKRVGNEELPGSGPSGSSKPYAGQIGFGNSGPPPYSSSGVGDPLEGSSVYGQREKR